MSSFFRSYLKGESLYWFWGLLEKLVTAAGAFFILSELDVYKYGVYILLFSFYSLTAGIFLQPLQEVVLNDIIRFSTAGRMAEAKKLYLENLTSRFILAFFLGVGLFFGAGIVSQYYGADLANLFRFLSVLYLIDVSNTSIRMFLRLKLKFGLVAARPVLFKIFRFISIILFLSLTSFGIREALLSHIFAAFLATAVFVPFFIREYRPWSLIKAAAGKIIIWEVIKRHGKWPLFGSALTQLVSNIRPWLIKFFVNTEAVAIYAVAESLYGTVKAFFPDSTLTALIPRKIADRTATAEIFVRGIKYLAVLSLGMVLLGFFLVPPVVGWLLPHYAIALPLFQTLLVLLLPLYAFRSISISLLHAMRRQKFLFFTGTIETVGELTLPIPFLYLFSIWGMVWERVLLSYLITLLVFGRLLKKEFNFLSLRQFFSFNRLDKTFLKEFLARLRHPFSLF